MLETPPERTGRLRARERLNARRTRAPGAGAQGQTAEVALPSARMIGWARQRRPAFSGELASWRQRVRVKARDASWYLLHRPVIPQAAAALVALLFALFVAVHVLGGRIFPGVSAVGVPLGDLTLDEAAAALRAAWASRVRVDLVDDTGRRWSVAPSELGLSLDARATAESARSVGMAGIPMGYRVLPVVGVDDFAAQTFFLSMTADANFAAYNAGFVWHNGELTGVPGREGRVLDVGATLETLKQTAASVVHEGRLTLVMSPLQPTETDPEPYLAEARALASQPFRLTGYDPFKDEYVEWATDRDTFTSWLQATPDGLALREDVFAEFIEAQNRSLNPDGTGPRYMEPNETMARMSDAIAAGRSTAQLRIRYRPLRYEIEAGDTGYRIARRLGIPFFALMSVNPGVEWEKLNIGDMINLPSRDLTLPLPPVPNKRIIVNLETQTLTAYEDGQLKFHWLISSGTSQFPTYPGVFQILTHNESAFGSTFELCGSSGCGQWEMYWFMGVYEVVPGLMNGFHGAVLLPNGAYLGGGNVGYPYTYGCIMSENSNAQQLYLWADQGTIVEIIDTGYPPESDLGRHSLAVAASFTGAAGQTT